MVSSVKIVCAEIFHRFSIHFHVPGALFLLVFVGEIEDARLCLLIALKIDFGAILAPFWRPRIVPKSIFRGPIQASKHILIFVFLAGQLSCTRFLNIASTYPQLAPQNGPKLDQNWCQNRSGFFQRPHQAPWTWMDPLRNQFWSDFGLIWGGFLVDVYCLLSILGRSLHRFLFTVCFIFGSLLILLSRSFCSPWPGLYIPGTPAAGDGRLLAPTAITSPLLPRSPCFEAASATRILNSIGFCIDFGSVWGGSHGQARGWSWPDRTSPGPTRPAKANLAQP